MNIIKQDVNELFTPPQEPPGAYNMGLGDISRVFVTMGKEGAKHDKGVSTSLQEGGWPS